MPAEKKSGNAFSSDTALAAILTLSVAAVQEMGLSSSPWIALALWSLNAYFVASVIWRDGRKGLSMRLALVALTVILTTWLCYRSWSGLDPTPGKVSVGFSRNFYTPATRLPEWREGSEISAREVLGKGPIMRLDLNKTATDPVVNVVIRDTSGIDLRNVDLNVTSFSPIEGVTFGAEPFSKTSVHYQKRNMRAYRKLGDQYFYTIKFIAPQPGLATFLGISIEADNMKSQAYVGVFLFGRGPLQPSVPIH